MIAIMEFNFQNVPKIKLHKSNVLERNEISCSVSGAVPDNISEKEEKSELIQANSMAVQNSLRFSPGVREHVCAGFVGILATALVWI
jgi:hypothetical protein